MINKTNVFMNGRVYFKLAFAYILAIVAIITITILVQRYTDLFDQRDAELKQEIQKQLQNTTNPVGNAISQEFEIQSKEIRDKERIIMFSYFFVFLLIIVFFLIFMLKKAIVD